MLSARGSDCEFQLSALRSARCPIDVRPYGARSLRPIPARSAISLSLISCQASINSMACSVSSARRSRQRALSLALWVFRAKAGNGASQPGQDAVCTRLRALDESGRKYIVRAGRRRPWRPAAPHPCESGCAPSSASGGPKLTGNMASPTRDNERAVPSWLMEAERDDLRQSHCATVCQSRVGRPGEHRSSTPPAPPLRARKRPPPWRHWARLRLYGRRNIYGCN